MCFCVQYKNERLRKKKKKLRSCSAKIKKFPHRAQPFGERKKSKRRKKELFIVRVKKMKFVFVLVFITLSYAGNSTIPNCAEEEDGKCIECDEDYFVTPQGLCGEQLKFIGCSKFNENGCEECKTNYTKISPYVCLECKKHFSHCSECTGLMCTKCENGYKLKDDNTCGSMYVMIVAVLAFVMLTL